MGSSMRKAVFTKHIVKGLKNWHNLAKRNLSKNRTSSIRQPLDSWPIDSTDMKILYHPKDDNFPPLEVMTSPSPEITEEPVQHNHTPSPAGTSFSAPEIVEEKTNFKITTRGNYDGETSFASIWKESASGKGIKDITSTSEENASDIINDFND